MSREKAEGEAILLTGLLAAAVVLFGGVYLWSASALAVAILALAVWVRPTADASGWLKVLDRSLVAILVGIAVQLIAFPHTFLSIVSPGRADYTRAMSVSPDVPALLPLTLDRGATLHAWIATFCCIATFLTARALFSRGGIRTIVTAVAWVAVAFALVAVAQNAANTSLVYGFWHPYDAGARPLGPFINRNHGGTWSLLAVMLCFGYLQWRRVTSSPPPASTWRRRVAHALNGRSTILVLAIVLLTLTIAISASRSTLVALATAVGYVAWTAPPGAARRGVGLRTAALALVTAFAIAIYADVETLLSRVDQTRRLGLSARAPIWRDTVGVIRDFPLTGVGAGNLATAMRVYQTSDRTYFWNEAHNEYLQIAAEGGVLVAIPVATAVLALIAAASPHLRRRDDPTAWMRVGAAGALVAVAVQAIWETGLALPANSMLAAVAAAIVVHVPRVPEKGVKGGKGDSQERAHAHRELITMRRKPGLRSSASAAARCQLKSAVR